MAVIDAHKYKVYGGNGNGDYGKEVLTDIAPPEGYGHAAVAGKELLSGRDVSVAKIEYVGPVKMSLVEYAPIKAAAKAEHSTKAGRALALNVAEE